MVIGTGIDIIEVERIERASKAPNFFERVFTENERLYFSTHGLNAQTVAGTFAAKALATGFDGVEWQDIEILRDEVGKPYVRLFKAALKRMDALGGKIIHVSISHIKELAIAQAILED
jgi:holo-[acyl-carrier-protein] synthase